MSDPDAVLVLAASLPTLAIAHSVGDHWVQTHAQACCKGRPGWAGRRACLAHVTTHTLTLAVALVAVVAVTGLHLSAAAVAAGLSVNAVTHYVADRRAPLAAFAGWLHKDGYWRLGSDVASIDGTPAVHLGTGAAHLDQAWHHAWLLVTALIIAAGA